MGQRKQTPQLLAHWSDLQPDQRARIEVETDCEGPLAHLGHRLRLAVNQYRVTLTNRIIEASITSSSLHAVGILRADGICHVDLPSDRDRAKIERIVHTRILQSDRFPTIDFSGEIRTGEEQAARVRGTLTLAGTRRPLTLEVDLRADAAVIEVPIRPSTWGIPPYSTLAGQLRVADRVLVRVVAPLPRLRENNGIKAWWAGAGEGARGEGY